RNSRCALRQCSPTAPGPAVLLGGGARGPKSKTTQNRPPCREGTHNTKIPLLHRLGFSGEAGAGGCVCLWPKAEFNAAARFARKTEGSPKGRRGWVPFCLVTYYFGQAK
ncbi:MAG: hypothetical protein Q8N74_04640, partial [Sulfuricella sp.]|nr:hypothetical protein [Sulfuricella sp.]